MSTPDTESKQDPQATVVAPRPTSSPNADPGATRVMPYRPATTVCTAAGIGASNGGVGKHAKPQRASRDKKPRRRGRGCLIALIVVAVLVAIAYGAGVAVFSHTYYPGTTIAGVDVSLIDAGSAATRIRSAMTRYHLTIEGSGFSWTYEPASADALIDSSNAAQTVLGQNDALRWPVHLYQALTTPATSDDTAQTAEADLVADPDFSLFSASFDEGAFEESLGAAIDKFNDGRSGTFDVASAYDGDAHTFTVDKARANEKLARDTVIAYAKHELSQLAKDAPLAALGDAAFEPLADGMGDSDIKTVCDATNNLLGADFKVMLNDNAAAEIGPNQVAQWIVLGKDLTPSIDQKAVEKWATELADGFDTVGTKRTYTREDGKKITVSGGSFGWEVDDDKLVSNLIDAVNNKSTGSVEVPTSQTGDVYNGQGERDWGAYVDVDIAEQHARYYDADGKLLWESGIITGNPTKKNDTPTGVYYLRSKSTDTMLRGPKDPKTGKYKWESKVAYWMPFKDNSVGLHDASWQASSSFENKNAYKTVGSHGCVNLPPSKAAELFKIIKVGTCVIVHK